MLARPKTFAYVAAAFCHVPSVYSAELVLQKLRYIQMLLFHRTF